MFKILLAAAIAAVGACQYQAPPNSSTTFTNPILETVGADP